VIGILVIAVIGGLRHPIGPFIGAAALRRAPRLLRLISLGAGAIQHAHWVAFLLIVFAVTGWNLGSLENGFSRTSPQKPHANPKGGTEKKSIDPHAGSSTEEAMKLKTRFTRGCAAGPAVALVPHTAMADGSIKGWSSRQLEGASHPGWPGWHSWCRACAQRGRLYGGGKKIEIIKGSSDASPDSAVKAHANLVEQDGVAILIGPLSARRSSVRDLRKDKPDVTFINERPAAQDTTLRDPAPNFFRFRTDGAQWMAGLGDYVFNVKKYKTLSPSPKTIPFPTRKCLVSWRVFCKDGGHVPKKFWVPIGNKELFFCDRSDT